MSQPHSKTVRGTLDNPKTQEAIKNDRRVPDIGDPTSLKPANDDDKKLPSNDSAPPSKSDAPTVSTPYESKGTSAGGGDKRAVGNGRDSSSSKDDLPHSQKVRGTLANNDGKEVNTTQLGDPASLKAETSSTKLDRDVESAGAPKSKL